MTKIESGMVNISVGDGGPGQELATRAKSESMASFTPESLDEAEKVLQAFNAGNSAALKEWLGLKK